MYEMLPLRGTYGLLLFSSKVDVDGRIDSFARHKMVNLAPYDGEK